VVLAANLAELHGVDDEAGVAVLREPNAVMLVTRFVAETDAVLDDVRMAADIQNGRQGLLDLLGQIEVRNPSPFSSPVLTGRSGVFSGSGSRPSMSKSCRRYSGTFFCQSSAL
jgi:hypothetical protein